MILITCKLGGTKKIVFRLALIAIVIGVGFMLINGIFEWGLFVFLGRLGFACAIVLAVIAIATVLLNLDCCD